MSGPSWRSTPFDFAAAPRSCSRSKVPTFGMSRSMMNLRSAISLLPNSNAHQCASPMATHSIIWSARARRVAIAATARPARVLNSLASSVPSLSGSPVVNTSSYEARLDDGEVVILGQRAVLIRIGGGKFLGSQSASHFALVESAVVITIELVEKGAPCLLDLVKIEGAVVVGVEFLYRTWASPLAEGRQAGAKHATENQDIQQCCASRDHLHILLGLTPAH